MDGNSFEGPAGELGCHSQYGSLGGKGKNAFRVSARRTRCARNASPLFPLTLGLGSPPPRVPSPPRLLTASKSLVAERSRTLVPTVMPGTNLTEEAEGQGQTDRQRPREGSEEVSRERPDLPGPLGVSVPRPEEPVPCSRPGFRMSPKQTWPRAGWERAHGATRVPAGSASLAWTLCMARSI